ncbi:probable methyltransferase-like protein 24 isoform X2 [Macrobrachium rosenbergii]
MDDDVRPKPTDCLVYSFGVGNDFSFDNCMQDYGCEVHSFDHDDDHEVYDYRQGPLAFFHKARIGYKDGYFRACEESQYGLKCEPSLRYYTIATIQRMLNHDARNLDYLKMDIEGSEWFVLGDIIHNSTLLQQTKQIALEIHMDEVNRQTSEEGMQKLLNKYLSVFSDLQKLGFALAAFEENGMRPIYSQIDGTFLSIYAEILLLKRNEDMKL